MQPEVIPHLFRTEFSRMAAVLCGHLGIHRLEIAEDLVSETFATALETWPRRGTPDNPRAWLYDVARKKALNYLRREKIFREKVTPSLDQPGTVMPELNEDLIKDSQLRLIFALCHPALPPEAQTGLALRILCGFGIQEIADAFMTGKETINKRLVRAREKLRTEGISLDLPPEEELNNRLDTVLTVIYLLFNEGYYSESNEQMIREDLCLEALRLAHLLTGYEITRKPSVYALLALMCFHTSRLRARISDLGRMIPFDEQDRSRWDPELIAQGTAFLYLASTGNELSAYHLEAHIARWHTTDAADKWEQILQLYNLLLTKRYSPVAALNRAYVICRVRGKKEALKEAEKLKLEDNHYYHTLLGHLYTGSDNQKARNHLELAQNLARTETDRQTLANMLNQLG